MSGAEAKGHDAPDRAELGPFQGKTLQRGAAPDPGKGNPCTKASDLCKVATISEPILDVIRHVQSLKNVGFRKLNTTIFRGTAPPKTLNSQQLAPVKLGAGFPCLASRI